DAPDFAQHLAHFFSEGPAVRQMGCTKVYQARERGRQFIVDELNSMAPTSTGCRLLRQAKLNFHAVHLGLRRRSAPPQAACRRLLRQAEIRLTTYKQFTIELALVAHDREVEILEVLFADAVDVFRADSADFVNPGLVAPPAAA